MWARRRAPGSTWRLVSSCLDEYDRSAFPLATPLPARAVAGRTASEPSSLRKIERRYGRRTPPNPPGAVGVWDEMLAYAGSHSIDPRIPEALQRLVHVDHFGGAPATAPIACCSSDTPDRTGLGKRLALTAKGPAAYACAAVVQADTKPKARSAGRGTRPEIGRLFLLTDTTDRRNLLPRAKRALRVDA